MTSAQREWGEGPLARGSAFIYTLLVTEALLVLTALPGLVPLVFLDRDPSNLPLAGLCVVPLGPAISAAVYALHRRSTDLTDLHPARAFWRGYRLNLASSLQVWVPWLAWLVIVGLTIANFGAAGVPGWWAVLLVLLAIGITLWMVNALVISSLFAFRFRDLARLASYFLARTPGVTLANGCLLIVAVAVIFFASEAVLVLLGSVFVLALLRGCQPMIAQVREEFVA
ncbi:MAG TPA: DUF624 domain-containing protein [Natronosporangium sp.]